jgi:Arc/MetJ family transcription regulator
MKGEDEMKENSVLNLSLSRETAVFLLDLLSRPETSGDEKKDALCDMIRAALPRPQQHPLETAKEEARTSLAEAVENLAQAESAFEESLAHGNENSQRTALAALSAGETRLQGSQAAYDAASRNSLDAKAERAEGNRRAAYAKSEKAYDEALAALRAYEPMAQEISKLFRILSFHTDLALADTEAADAARISPHAASAADHLKKVLEEQKMGHSETVTKHVVAALHELELAGHVRN